MWSNLPPDGMTPTQQLERIRAIVLSLMQEQRRIFYEDLLPLLDAAGIRIHRYADLSDADCDWLRAYFQAEILPVLTPLGVDTGRPFPHISNLSLNLAVMVRNSKGEELFARVKVPPSLPRLLPLEDGQTFRVA